MPEYDEWKEVEDSEESEEKISLKKALSPCVEGDMPIPIRFLKTTKGLFYEHRHHTTVNEKAPYTLRYLDFTDSKGHTYKSMYMIYMDCDSEYEAAIRLLGSYHHWLKLKRCSWFQDYVQVWEQERNIRDEAIARTILVRLAEVGNVTAAKTLYTNAEKVKGKIGRPPKGGSREESEGSDELAEMLRRSVMAEKE